MSMQMSRIQAKRLLFHVKTNVSTSEAIVPETTQENVTLNSKTKFSSWTRQETEKWIKKKTSSTQVSLFPFSIAINWMMKSKCKRKNYKEKKMPSFHFSNFDFMFIFLYWFYEKKLKYSKSLNTLQHYSYIFVSVYHFSHVINTYSEINLSRNSKTTVLWSKIEKMTQITPRLIK